MTNVLKAGMSNFEMVAVFSEKYYDLSDMLINKLMKVSEEACLGKLQDMEQMYLKGGKWICSNRQTGFVFGAITTSISRVHIHKQLVTIRMTSEEFDERGNRIYIQAKMLEADVSPFAKPKRKISAEQKRALSERAKMRFKVQE